MPRAKKIKIPEIISSDTALVADRWLYRWTGEPPREFYLFKTLFHTLSPADIVSNGWDILKPAVGEMAACCGLEPCKERIDWLRLEDVRQNVCRVAVQGDRVVSAAAPLSSQRHPFIPARFFRELHENPQWRDLHYSCSYRHFAARFHTDRTFCTERLGLLCDTGYYVHFGIHGVHSLWSVLRIGDRLVGGPFRLRISGMMDDLPGKVDRISRLGQAFVGRLGTTWIRGHERYAMWDHAAKLLKSISTPAYRLNELRHDAELERCMTKLDLLLFLSKIFQSDPKASVSDMLKLSRNLYFSNQQ